jgi:hypothetical protein
MSTGDFIFGEARLVSLQRKLAVGFIGAALFLSGCASIVDPLPPGAGPQGPGGDAAESAPAEPSLPEPPTLRVVTPPPAGEIEPGSQEDGGGPVFLDEMGVALEGSPPAPYLSLVGNLPTPCHELLVSITVPDEQNRIVVRVSSRADPETVCIQVLAPLDEKVPLGEYPPGAYSVLLNGEQAGEFVIPG